MGSKELFKDLSFGVFQGEKIGLTGPNGAGKSTLLKIIAQQEPLDSGEVSIKRDLKIAFVAQKNIFPDKKSISEYLKEKLITEENHEDMQAEIQAALCLSLVGFEDLDLQISTLSGGWKKRLAISCAIATEPELLILDEPTNHMDWDGILWLESWLKTYKDSLLLVSHDRRFLENNANRMIEINRLYKDGVLSFNCAYEEFLQKKAEYFKAQLKQQESMSNKASRELDWLRAGVKARTTKSKSRMDNAYALMDELDDLKKRNASVQHKSRMEVDSSERKTKKLVDLKHVDVGFENNVLIKDINLTLGPKMCLGLLGANGSGKSSLLKTIIGSIKPLSGELFLADDLKVVFFDQARESIEQDINLIDYLGDGAEYVIFKDQSIHVASYASRFLFHSEKMHLKISQLSGGEQARLLIAKVLLKPADVLILDEPTNDLDIDTIEILEDTLAQFPGLIILVSHDRSFLDKLCDQHLALDGQGGWLMYASLNQWLKARFKKNDSGKSVKTDGGEAKKVKTNFKLSYKDKRFLETVEKDLEVLEGDLSKFEKLLEDPKIMSNQQELNIIIKKIADQQKLIESTYQKWEVVEKKKAK